MDARAFAPPIVTREFTAAYVVAKWAICNDTKQSIINIHNQEENYVLGFSPTMYIVQIQPKRKSSTQLTDGDTANHESMTNSH